MDLQPHKIKREGDFMSAIVLLFIFVGGIIIMCRRCKTTQNYPSQSHCADGNYRNDEREFRTVIYNRNPQRDRRHEDNCDVCGAFFGLGSLSELRQIDPRDGHKGICKQCHDWISAELQKQDESIRNDSKLLCIAASWAKIRLIIALDVKDGIIDDSCAKADLEAAKRYEEMDYKRILRNREFEAKRDNDQRQRRETDYAAANEILNRLK